MKNIYKILNLSILFESVVKIAGEKNKERRESVSFFASVIILGVEGGKVRVTRQEHRVPTLPPSFTRIATACKNHLNEEIIPLPLLPTGIGERYCQTISDLGHAALLRRCELFL